MYESIFELNHFQVQILCVNIFSLFPFTSKVNANSHHYFIVLLPSLKLILFPYTDQS